MKLIFLGATAFALIIGTTFANATTCQQRAANCNRLGGGGACFESSRMASCKKTGTYVAPSGRTWEAKDK